MEALAIYFSSVVGSARTSPNVKNTLFNLLALRKLYGIVHGVGHVP